MTSNTQKGCCEKPCVFGNCGRGTKEGCTGAHCRCMEKDCPNMHYVDCKEHYIHVENVGHTPPESTLAYCTTCVQMTNHGIGTNGGCLKCRVTTPPESKGVEEEIDRRVALYGMAYKGILPDDTIKRSQEHWKNELLDFAQFFTTHRTQLLQEIEGEVESIPRVNPYDSSMNYTGGQQAEIRAYNRAFEDILTIIRNKQIP